MQARFAADRVRISGRATEYLRISDEGRAATFHFCPECGATVYYQTDPEMIAVPIGAFADPEFPPPKISVWESRRHAWVAVPAQAERHD